MVKENNKRPKPDHNTSRETSNNDLADMIASLRESMQTKLTNLGDELRVELRTGLEGIKEDLTKANARMNQISDTVNINTSSIARSLLSNDLIVSGVPVVLDEDLSRFYLSWCQLLGYEKGAYPLADLKRLARPPLREGSACLILIQFAITNQRNDFYGRYMQLRTLTLSQIGFDSDQRIYINENLIPADRKLKIKAVELKRAGKLSAVYSRGGVIHVKLPDSDQHRPVNSEQELLKVALAK